MAASSTVSVIEALRAHLLEDLADAEDLRDLGPDDNLIAEGLIDSIGAMRLAMFIEEEFAIEVGPVDVTIANFRSLDSLATFIRGRLTNAA